MSCDLLVLAPHPDDAELHCGATIANQTRRGRRVVLVDATRGELGSRGDAEGRARESAAAAAVLGVGERENLGLPDGGLADCGSGLQTALVDCLRRHRPRLVLAMHPHTRHPDHIAWAAACWPALKAAALHALPTPSGTGAVQGLRGLQYEAELPITPGLLVACTEADRERKEAALDCYASQFTPDPTAPPTSIGGGGFRRWIEHRGRAWGHHAGSAYAEAFACPDTPALADLGPLLTPTDDTVPN